MKKNSMFRAMIKVWIALTSLAAFLFGWAILGHSGKPVSAGVSVQPQLQPIPTLAPIPPLNTNTGFQPLPQQQSAPSFNFFGGFRTRGS